VKIRKEIPKDIPSIYLLNESAFESDAEAKLVNELRTNIEGVISLVALDGDNVVGHIMFSPVTIIGSVGVKLYGLAPMAVDPKLQNNGIGSLLVEAGLKECMSQQVSAVFVLGHPNYYPRFGFRPSNNFGIKSEYDVPADVFMGKELVSGALNSIEGVVKYSAEFGSV
jgi:putative acetyltransferase